MIRDAALSYLTSEYADLATDAKFTSTQTTTAYSTAIDTSLLQLGFTESELATADTAESDALKYRALLRYYALKRFCAVYAIRFNVKAGSGAIEAERNQAFKNLFEGMLASEAAELTQYGISVGGVESMQFGRLNLDYLEPSAARSEF